MRLTAADEMKVEGAGEPARGERRRGATSAPDVRRAVARAAAALFGARAVCILVDDPDAGLSGIPPGVGAVDRICASRVPEFIEEVGQDAPAIDPRLVGEHPVRGFAGLPLMVEDRVLGVLCLVFPEPRRFTPYETRGFTALADQVAIAFEHARVLEEAERRREAAEKLAEVGAMLSHSLDSAAVAQQVAECVRTLLNAQASAVFRRSPETGDLIALAVSGDPGPAVGPNTVFPEGTGVAGLAVRERRPVVTPDMFADPRITLTPELRARLEQARYRAVLSVPLMFEDGVIGVLSIGDQAGRVFREEEVRLARAFADQAAVALKNAELYRRAEERAERLRGLSALTRVITSDADRRDIFDAVSRAAVTALGASVARVWVDEARAGVLRAQGNFVQDPAVRGLLDEASVIPHGQGLIGHIHESRQAEFVEDVQTDPRLVNQQLAGEARLHAFVGLPLVAGGRVVGVLAILFGEPHRFTPQEKEVMGLLADHAAIAIHNACLFAETEGRRKAAQALAEVGRLMSQSLEPGQVGRWIVESLRTLLRVQVAVLFRLVPESDALAALAASGDPGIETSRLVLPPGTGSAGLAVRERAAVVSADLFADSRVTLAPETRRRLEASGHRAALAVPLVVKDSVIGALVVRDQLGRVFHDEEIRLACAFADQAAVALENARLYEQSEARGRRQAALVEVAQRLTRGLDLPTVLGAIAQAAATVFEGEAGFRLREGEDLVRMGTTPGACAAMVRERLRVGESLSGQVAVTGRPIVTNDSAADPRILPEHRAGIQPDRTGALMCVPIRAGTEVLGTLHVFRERGYRFDDSALQLATSLADQAAIAIQNARLFQETERRRRAAEALSAVGRLISQSLDPVEVRQRIVDSVRGLLGTRYASLLRLEPESGDLVLVAGSAESREMLAPGLVFPRGTGVASLAVRERRPATTPDLLEDPRITLTDELRKHIERTGYGAVLAVPLLVQDRVVGALGVADERGRAFTADEIGLAQAFADQAALAVENARLHTEVRDARDFLQSIAENSPDAIATTDTHGRLTFLSPGAVETFGYSVEEALGRPLAEFYRGGVEEARAVMARLKAEGRVRSYETSIRARDGRWVDVNASLSLLRDAAGTIIGTLGVVKDVTERKRLEGELRQSQKLEAIGRLAGGVAHDFNNLMTVITGRSQLLLDRLRAEDPLRRDIELMRKTSDRAAALTRQLLAFGRKQVLQPKVLDLNAVVAGMKSMLRRLIGEHIELAFVLDPELRRVKADPGQLEQVVVNLAVNARDAMPTGGQLILETSNVLLDEAYAARHVGVKPGAYVCLAVTDTGVGMDEATRARVFEPFFTTKGVGKGTGLGLATVYGIVKQSGGNIWCYSEPGRGTAFKIYLPGAEEAVQPGGPPPLPEPRRGTETILLVEDEDELRAVAREVLEVFGYTVLAAGHPEEALLMAERHSGPIHLLLTDVVMPKMSGRDLATRLAPLRPEMKVLYTSGYTDDAIVHHGVLDPGIPFLEKPFDPAVLAVKVREVLDPKRL